VLHHVKLAEGTVTRKRVCRFYAAFYGIKLSFFVSELWVLSEWTWYIRDMQRAGSPGNPQRVTEFHVTEISFLPDLKGPLRARGSAL
jgi:hypothetical protein